MKKNLVVTLVVSSAIIVQSCGPSNQIKSPAPVLTQTQQTQAKQVESIIAANPGIHNVALEVNGELVAAALAPSTDPAADAEIPNIGKSDTASIVAQDGTSSTVTGSASLTSIDGTLTASNSTSSPTQDQIAAAAKAAGITNATNDALGDNAPNPTNSGLPAATVISQLAAPGSSANAAAAGIATSNTAAPTDKPKSGLSLKVVTAVGKVLYFPISAVQSLFAYAFAKDNAKNNGQAE